MLCEQPVRDYHQQSKSFTRGKLVNIECFEAITSSTAFSMPPFSETPLARDRLTTSQLRLSLTTSETQILLCEGERTAPRGTPGCRVFRIFTGNIRQKFH